jgi:tetratricopeptide (TPR) repeat protein
MGSSRAYIAVVIVLAATAASPGVATAYTWSEKVTLAWKLLQGKDYQRALSVSEEAVAEKPGDPVALAVRGTAYMYAGQYDRSIADHDAVLKMTPDDPGALTNSCEVRAVANVQLDLALTYCDRAVANSRVREFAAYDTRGFLHLKRGEYALAVADYDRALRLYGKLPTSLFGRGLAKLSLGNDAEGRADLAKATKMDPSVADAFASKGIKP